ncbi:MAG: hypothetical protein RIR12_1103 [Bacteroidota bacterium]|jgi:predicted CoA-binding protein
MSTEKKTLLIGASNNPDRYSYLALKKLQAYHHPVAAIGVKNIVVSGVQIYTTQMQFENIHTVSIYINPSLQASYYSYLINLKPKRIIFNPGTENHELAALAAAQGIEVIEACTLVMLAVGTY